MQVSLNLELATIDGYSPGSTLATPRLSTWLHMYVISLSQQLLRLHRPAEGILSSRLL